MFKRDNKENLKDNYPNEIALWKKAISVEDNTHLKNIKFALFIRTDINRN
jgi:hypothetical protein